MAVRMMHSPWASLWKMLLSLSDAVSCRPIMSSVAIPLLQVWQYIVWEGKHAQAPVSAATKTRKKGWLAHTLSAMQTLNTRDDGSAHNQTFVCPANF